MKTPVTSRGFATLMLAVLVSGCGGVAHLGPQSIKLAMAFKPNQVTKYNLKMSINGTTTAAAAGATTLNTVVTAVETLTVKSVDSSGTATLDVALSNLQTTVNGQAAQLPQQLQNVTTTEQITSDGRVILANGATIAGGGLSGASQVPGANQFAPLLPDHSVKVGDTWTKNVSQANPFGTGNINYTGNSTYLRDETVQGHRDAVVETKATIPLDVTVDFGKLAQATGLSSLLEQAPQLATLQVTEKGDTSQDNVSDLDFAANQLDKTHMTLKFNLTTSFTGAPAGSPLAGQQLPITGTVTIDLVRA